MMSFPSRMRAPNCQKINLALLLHIIIMFASELKKKWGYLNALQCEGHNALQR